MRTRPSSRAEREDFAARVRGDHPEQQSYMSYVLGQLRCARTRAKLLVSEIDNIGHALKSGAIDADRALADLYSIGGLEFMQPSEPPYERPEEPADAEHPDTAQENPHPGPS